MLVYRLLDRNELNILLNGDINQLGAVFHKNLSNNHKYKNNVKYVHFFKNKKNIKLIYLSKGREFNENKEQFIATFDIPLKVLLCHSGKGIYELPGMEYLIVKEREYAIPIKEIKKEWFISYKKYDYSKSTELEK